MSKEQMQPIQAEQPEAKRLGRPPKAEQPLKKGKRSWKPATLNEFFDKEPGYRYRMASKDPFTLAKRKQEGWETVSALSGNGEKHQDPQRVGLDGKALTSAIEGPDWILQRVPEEIAQEMDSYFQDENDRRTAGLTSHLKKEIHGQGTSTHGEITINSRKGTQIID